MPVSPESIPIFTLYLLGGKKYRKNTEHKKKELTEEETSRREWRDKKGFVSPSPVS